MVFYLHIHVVPIFNSYGYRVKLHVLREHNSVNTRSSMYINVVANFNSHGYRTEMQLSCFIY